ncbi:TonB family protein [Algoriphagus halophytocola]|uniref:TonB family protein n=1 Tax=Algoriphagus halophytocola TaxID=2991499 RepID=A0ABY6MIP7_9BACT|nr:MULTISPECIES: energy transducer TonB [unclassified Algoriphagus]UZD23508.1 TonB family protein [Algoriphagus sp. TR-M5]WBL44802.1 TonB family protein [Algoriphagus sp. TR-M9]
MKNKVEIIDSVYLEQLDIEKHKDFDAILRDYNAMKSKSFNWRGPFLWALLALIFCSITALLLLNGTDQDIEQDDKVSQSMDPPTDLQTDHQQKSRSSRIMVDSISQEKNKKPEKSQQDRQHPSSTKATEEPEDIVIEVPPLVSPEIEIPEELLLDMPDETEVNTSKGGVKNPMNAEIKLEEAYPVDGFENLYTWFEANITYPEEYRKDAIEGTVKVSFLLNEDSTISGISVSQSLGDAFDGEAIRLIENMPKWVPAKRNGIPFSKRFVLPIGFKVEKR